MIVNECSTIIAAAPAGSSVDQAAAEIGYRRSRLIVETCRAPDPAQVSSHGSSGGLVAALAPVMGRRGGSWIGGFPVPEARSRCHERTGRCDAATVPAPTEAPECGFRQVAARYPEQLHGGFYNRLANGVLWPLYHSMLNAVGAARPCDWRDYVRVNRCFARSAAEQALPHSFVWIHDYQLSLVPALLRQQAAAEVRIGFFLHTPFPVSGDPAQVPLGR